MLLNLDMTNNGIFEQDISVKIDIPSFGYTDTSNVHLSQTASVPYTIVVPSTISPGTHSLDASLNLINQLVKTYHFGVPASRLNLSIGKSNYSAGETGTVKVENRGGVDTNFEINIKLYDMNADLVTETNTSSSVEASSYLGDRTNFGFTMKYNSQYNNVQGDLLLISHLPDGTIYKLKSDDLYALSVGEGYDGNGEPFTWASFSGNATYLEPGWAEPEEDYEFIVYVEDRNEPGQGIDRFWIEVRDRNGNIVSGISMNSPAPDNTQELQGGNIVVH